MNVGDKVKVVAGHGKHSGLFGEIVAINEHGEYDVRFRFFGASRAVFLRFEEEEIELEEMEDYEREDYERECDRRRQIQIDNEGYKEQKL